LPSSEEARLESLIIWETHVYRKKKRKVVPRSAIQFKKLHAHQGKVASRVDICGAKASHP
jgi:hypothetical protein